MQGLTDVIIIGSGPAGIAAAITCANAGLKTILLSKPVPAEKKNSLTPSESVHPGIASLLEMLHATDALTAASRSTYEGITINGEHTLLGADESGTWKGHHIDRILFDRHLLAAAREQGVTIYKNETVNEILQEQDRVTGVRTSSGKTIHSRYVIDCSGHQRIAGKKLKFKERFYSPPFVVWTGVAENIDASFFNTAKTEFIPATNGWSWLAPERPDRCTWTRLALKGENDFLQPAELDKYGSTTELFVSNRRWRVFRPLVKEGILLCGDAAGILDPAAGQGILNALWSGIKAGQCVGQCISNSAMESFFLAQYDNWFIAQYEEKVEKLKEYYAAFGIKLFDKKASS
jgi:flavin-dependent dehydrogenase